MIKKFKKWSFCIPMQSFFASVGTDTIIFPDYDYEDQVLMGRQLYVRRGDLLSYSAFTILFFQPFANELELFEHVHTHCLNGKQHCRWKGNMHYWYDTSQNLKIVFCFVSDIAIRHKGHFFDHIITHFTADIRPCVCEVKIYFLKSLIV